MLRQQQPKHYRQRLAADLGRAPSDAELAGVLAMNIERVRRHRAAIEGGRR